MSTGMKKGLARLALIAAISFTYTAYFGFHMPETFVMSLMNVLLSYQIIDWLWRKFPDPADKPKRKAH